MHHVVLAYIDAGTGSMLLQAAIAAIVALPIILRTQIARAARFVRFRGRGEDPGADGGAGPA